MNTLEITLSIIGTTVAVVGIILGLGPLVTKYKEILSEGKIKKSRKKQAEFYSVLNSVEFQNWRDEILRKIYGEKYFTEVFKVLFPAFSIPFDRIYSYKEFQQLYSKNDINFEQYIIKDNELILPEVTSTNIFKKGNPNEIKLKQKMYKEYSQLLQGSIRCPLLVGFMLDHYKLDSDNRISHIYCKLGNYEQNVYSSHILEYEIYKAYLSLKGKEFTMDDLWELLPFRYYIHHTEGEKNDIEKVLFSGIGRYSLLSVQCFVMFLDHNKNEYVSLLMKRSEDPSAIAAKLGFYQFLPAGGFEMYEKEKIHTTHAILENYSLRKAILREYLEEVFGLDDFKSVDSSDNRETTYNILNHKEVECVLNMIDKGTASFGLLGVSVDLVSLRHELSFVLKIDDIAYSKKAIYPNNEFTREESVASKIRIPVLELEELLDGKHNINQGSAILYDLVKKSYLFPSERNS